MPQYLEIVRLSEHKVSQREISRTVGSGRDLIRRVLKIASEKNLNYATLSKLSSSELECIFTNKRDNRTRSVDIPMPDYAQLSKELAKPGVTLQLLWEEYVAQCKQSHQLFYRLTQFKKYFTDYLAKQPFTNVIKHKAGEKVQVDWAGQRPRWIDPHTGEIIQAYLFVAVLPFSGYGYAHCFADMKQANWIEAHIDLFDFLGGVPVLLISDNLKTGVTKHSKTEVLLNQSYEDLASYYHTVVIPARVKHPKDKGYVETTVKWFTTNIIARMRHYQCFSIDEYNHYLQIELKKLNAQPFQKKQGSRTSVFTEIEQNILQALPKYPYQYCTFKTAKVYANSHISVAKHYYSVPYKYIGQTVTLKLYQDYLEVFIQNQFLCRHSTKNALPGAYTTDEKHLPPNSAAFGSWNSTRYKQWARRVGPNVAVLVDIFFQKGPEQQYYRRVHSLLKLADKATDRKLDRACQLALEKTQKPSYQFVKSILDQLVDELPLQSDVSTPEQSFVRGADYYDTHRF